MRTAANLTSCLLAHYIATKLETILDKEGKISHEDFSTQIEARLGSGEGDSAKGPDMKVWSKGRNLKDVRLIFLALSQCSHTLDRLTGAPRSSVTLPSYSQSPQHPDTI